MFYKSCAIIRSYNHYIRTIIYFSSQNLTKDAIILSDNCVQKLKQLCDGKSDFLRLCVESGGCSGFQYKFQLDNKLAADDSKIDNLILSDHKASDINITGFIRQPALGQRGGLWLKLSPLEGPCPNTGNIKIFKRDGAQIVIDETSLEFIKGATIDYHTELIRSAFRVVQNPNADIGCSCGASFSIKIE